LPKIGENCPKVTITLTPLFIASIPIFFQLSNGTTAIQQGPASAGQQGNIIMMVPGADGTDYI
jgi:hypothetical protein